MKFWKRRCQRRDLARVLNGECVVIFRARGDGAIAPSPSRLVVNFNIGSRLYNNLTQESVKFVV